MLLEIIICVTAVVVAFLLIRTSCCVTADAAEAIAKGDRKKMAKDFFLLAVLWLIIFCIGYLSEVLCVEL